MLPLRGITNIQKFSSKIKFVFNFFLDFLIATFLVNPYFYNRVQGVQLETMRPDQFECTGINT